MRLITMLPMGAWWPIPGVAVHHGGAINDVAGCGRASVGLDQTSVPQIHRSASQVSVTIRDLLIDNWVGSANCRHLEPDRHFLADDAVWNMNQELSRSPGEAGHVFATLYDNFDVRHRGVGLQLVKADSQEATVQARRRGRIGGRRGRRCR